MKKLRLADSKESSEEELKFENNSSSDEDNDSMDDCVIIDSVPKTSYDVFAESIFGDITKASAYKQIAIGGVAGCVSGYIANRVGKLAAVVVGGSLLLVQIAQYNGYINVDWIKVRHALTQAQVKARRTMLKRSNSVLQKGQNFYDENFFLASGFSAGFLIGFMW